MRTPRVLPLLVLLGLAAGVAALVRGRPVHAGGGSASSSISTPSSHSAAPAARPREPATQVVASLARELGAFRIALDAFREGDASAEKELDALAQRLGALGRPDADDVLAYYRALSADERRSGRADERRFEDLWTRAAQADRAFPTREEWAEERDEIVRALDTFVAEQRSRADFVPAARARSLRARLAIDRAENDDELASDETHELVEAARADAEDALAGFERAGLRTPQLEPLWILGRVARMRGEVARADGFLTRCLELARAVSNTDFERHALTGLLAQARDDGDLRNSARIVHELARLDAQRAEDQGGPSWPIVRTHADLLLAGDDAPEAVALLERMPRAESAEADEWRVRLAGALTRANRRDEARALLDDGSLTRADEIELARAVIDLADGRAASALARARAVLAGEAADVRARRDARWIAGEALLDLGRPAEARAQLATLLESGEREQRERMRARDTRSISANVLGEIVGLHALALHALACVQDDLALDAALSIERHQAQLLRADPASGTGPELTDADLRAWAAHFDAGLLTWVVGADASVVVHVAPDGNAKGEALPLGRRALELASRRLREAAIAGDELRTAALAEEIEPAIFGVALRERLRELLAPGGRILCLVHGPIEALALERLPLFCGSGSGADPARALVCLPGLPSARPGTAPDLRGATWSLLGAPIDVEGGELLPGAAAELDDLERTLGDVELARGARFDRGALVAALASGRPLHVATHALHDTRCDSGRFAAVGLELSRGDVLCAREISALRPALPLAFLSACESGGGLFVDAQGLQGLARAFLESGTRDLIVTLWPVEDLAAREFAREFHRRHAAGAPPSVAAAQARAVLRRSGFASADWSAFRALGRD